MTAPLSPSLPWTTLLAHWLDYARASVALPDDAEGVRWRDSVAPVIELQAVTFALADLERVDPDERAIARDKAAVLVERATARLGDVWRGAPLPDDLLEIAADARAALDRTARAGAIELVWEGPRPMVVPALDAADLDADAGGTLAVMAPGTIVMPGEPVAWWRGRAPLRIPGCTPRPTLRPRQVYRTIDERGRVTGDVVAPVDAAMPPGLPLLVPLREDGEPIGRFTMEPREWERRQRAGMTGDEVPVRFEGTEGPRD